MAMENDKTIINAKKYFSAFQLKEWFGCKTIWPTVESGECSAVPLSKYSQRIIDHIFPNKKFMWFHLVFNKRLKKQDYTQPIGADGE
jgi:hypothetical protein